jgi:serine/threonine-protein phosphatase 6 regulatory ankyrin repeat subunit B
MYNLANSEAKMEIPGKGDNMTSMSMESTLTVCRGTAVLLAAMAWNTPAFCSEIHDAAARGDLPAVTSLLAKGTDVNARTDDGQTALMFASSNGHKDVVQLLVDKGADVNAKTTAQIITAMQFGGNFSGTAEIYSVGSRALVFAATHGHTEVVQLLLAKGANVNAKDETGYTALINASAYGHKEVVQLMLGKGADVNAKANNGTSALSIASQHGDNEIKELLIKAGAR